MKKNPQTNKELAIRKYEQMLPCRQDATRVALIRKLVPLTGAPAEGGEPETGEKPGNPPRPGASTAQEKAGDG